MKIAVIGCGVMGGAIAKHFAGRHSVFLYDQDKRKASHLAEAIRGVAATTLAEALQDSEAVLLAIKPKDLSGFAKEAEPFLSKGQLIMSILAGTSVDTLKKCFPHGVILRTMPNLALTCGKGIVGLVDDGSLADEKKRQIEELLNGLGLLTWLPENKIEALTALAASGPAFIYVILEAMIESGITMGFAPKESEEYASMMIEGAIALLRHTGKHPADIKWQIASPGGTTIAGLNEMEERGVRSGIIKTFLATYKRAQNL